MEVDGGKEEEEEVKAADVARELVSVELTSGCVCVCVCVQEYEDTCIV